MQYPTGLLKPLLIVRDSQCPSSTVSEDDICIIIIGAALQPPVLAHGSLDVPTGIDEYDASAETDSATGR